MTPITLSHTRHTHTLSLSHTHTHLPCVEDVAVRVEICGVEVLLGYPRLHEVGLRAWRTQIAVVPAPPSTRVSVGPPQLTTPARLLRFLGTLRGGVPTVCSWLHRMGVLLAGVVMLIVCFKYWMVGLGVALLLVDIERRVGRAQGGCRGKVKHEGKRAVSDRTTLA
jgi:hypothetical protein